MKLSILIVNWNTRDLVISCVNSVLANAPTFDYEIIVVDNFSQDGSADVLVSLFGHNKKIRVIQSLRNLGFAKGNNLAYEDSSGEYILLLNPDTEVRPEALQSLVEYLESHPTAGVVGPQLRNPDGTLQPSVRRFPGTWSSMIVFSGLHRFFRPHRYLMDDFSYEETADVDQVMGAALLTRRSIIREFGGFLDEKFWLWYEEVDFCKRVKAAGYQIKYYPKAVIMHQGAQSFSQMQVYKRKRVAARSLIYYFQKHGNLFDVAMIRVALPIVLFAAKLLDYLQKAFRFKLKIHV